MSPIALKLLTIAYEQYLKTFNRECTYMYKNADDMFYSTEAIKQLYDDGYIDNVPEFVFHDTISIAAGPISFEITDRGIGYMRSNRKE